MHTSVFYNCKRPVTNKTGVGAGTPYKATENRCATKAMEWEHQSNLGIFPHTWFIGIATRVG
jgi:hypothetical protein